MNIFARFSCLFLLGFAQLGAAQAGSLPGEIDSIRVSLAGEILRLSGQEVDIVGLVDETVEPMFIAMSQSAGIEDPRLRGVMVETMLEIFSLHERGLKDLQQAGNLRLARGIEAEDLRAIRDFYASPAGQAMVAYYKANQRQSAMEMGVFLQSMQADIERLLPQRMQEAGLFDE